MPLRVQLKFSGIDSTTNSEDILSQSENISTERNFHRYVYKEDEQQEYIRNLSERLENMFANFIE